MSPNPASTSSSARPPPASPPSASRSPSDSAPRSSPSTACRSTAAWISAPQSPLPKSARASRTTFSTCARPASRSQPPSTSPSPTTPCEISPPAPAKPLFIGGTALYIKSLLVGIFDGPSADWDFRRSLRAEADALGIGALHERLRTIDPAAAARIHPNDFRRIERALEIHAKTGLAPSTLRREWGRGDLRYDARIAGLDWPRAVLYKRIDARVDAMMAAGWLDEVKRLLSGPGLGREASQALGYKELAEVVDGRLALSDAAGLIKTRTRQFAKRQMTWFRSFPEVCWVRPSRAALDPEPSDVREMADRVMECFQA